MTFPSLTSLREAAHSHTPTLYPELASLKPEVSGDGVDSTLQEESLCRRDVDLAGVSPGDLIIL